jgi:NTP pyrophosphatase (non-canonical NTP hydrolase)
MTTVGIRLPGVCADLDWLSDAIHARNAHFYRNLQTGEPILDTVTERFAKMMLMVSEIAEMSEGVRKNLPDDKLPQYSAEEVELADLLIRAFDYAGWRKLRLGEAFWAKLEYNRTRQDHTDAARRAAGGKAI